MANLVLASSKVGSSNYADGKVATKLDPYIRLTLDGTKHQTGYIEHGGAHVEYLERHNPKVHFPYKPGKHRDPDEPITLKIEALDEAPGVDKFIGKIDLDLRAFFRGDLEGGTETNSAPNVSKTIGGTGSNSRFKKPVTARPFHINDPGTGLPTGTIFMTIEFWDENKEVYQEHDWWCKDGFVHCIIHTAEDLKDPNVSAVLNHSTTMLYVCFGIIFAYLGVGVIAYSMIGLTFGDLTDKAGNPVKLPDGSTYQICQKTVEWWEALYYVITTMTTIGYGDYYPCNTAGRVLTFFYIFLGLVGATTALGIVAEYFQNKSSDKMVKSLDTNDEDDISPEQWNVITSIVIYVVMLVIGAVFIMRDGESFSQTPSGTLNFADAMYWAMVTSSTVGYGDIGAQTPAGKVFMYFYMIASILITGNTVAALVAASLAAKKKRDRERMLSQAIGTKHDLVAIKQQSAKMHLKDPTMSKQDQDDKVTKLEYLVYFLMKLGHCDEEHIDEILLQFDKTDADGSGTLEAEDFIE